MALLMQNTLYKTFSDHFHDKYSAQLLHMNTLPKHQHLLYMNDTTQLRFSLNQMTQHSANSSCVTKLVLSLKT